MSFTRVTKANPCPVCKKPDWCRVFADGWVECMRVQSDRPAKSGGFMHRLEDGPRLYVPLMRFAPPVLNAAKLHGTWLNLTSTGLMAGLADSLGLSCAAIMAVQAAWAEPHKAWAFPMRDGYGNVVGIRLRRPDGFKFAVRGSRQGIFLTDRPPQETLFVCEGPTDTAAAIELGLFAVGRPNCCCGGAEIKTYAQQHAVTRVVIIADNDKPGLDGARKVGGELKLPFAIYVPPAKDLREFVQLGGTRAMIENTLKGTVWQNGSR